MTFTRSTMRPDAYSDAEMLGLLDRLLTQPPRLDLRGRSSSLIVDASGAAPCLSSNSAERPCSVLDEVRPLARGVPSGGHGAGKLTVLMRPLPPEGATSRLAASGSRPNEPGRETRPE
jgi:hypothetical protein